MKSLGYLSIFLGIGILFGGSFLKADGSIPPPDDGTITPSAKLCLFCVHPDCTGTCLPFFSCKEYTLNGPAYCKCQF